MTKIKALLFDLDGTLTHTDPIHFRAIQRLLADEGAIIDEIAFREHVSGRSNAEIGLRLFPSRPDEHLALLARKEALFRKFAVDLVPLAGLVEFMGRAALRFALVTNAPRENVAHMLGAIGLTDLFETIVYGDEMDSPKPDPQPYLTGLQRLGVLASEALAFEDSLPGVRSAKAAGIVTVGIATTRTEVELSSAGADLVVMDYTDPRLVDLLDRGAGQQ